LLGGKLVCLGGDQCAIGRITKMEAASDKSFPDSIDNDFSLNLLLGPHELDEFANDSRINNYYKVAIDYRNPGADKPQGDLISEQTKDGKPRNPNDFSQVLMPIPHDPNLQDPNPSDRYYGYTTDYPSSNYLSYDPSQNPFQVPGSDGGAPFSVPILHLECEGSRIFDVCQVLSSFWNPISNTVCQIPLIGSVVCFFVSLAVAPLLLPAVIAAWQNAQDGSADDPRVYGASGQVELGDPVVVVGRWVYDAAHQGWNELHPVKSIQKIDPNSYSWTNFADFRNQWCALTSEVPPYEDPGVQPAGMTPAQTQVYNSQRQPENRWYLHPLIDGCEPTRSPQIK
jgi:hypothetical protein